MVKSTKKKRKGNLRKKSRRHRNSRGGGSAVAICISSHSTFFDVLQINIDYLSKLFKSTDQKIYIFIDKEFTGNTHGLTYETIIYDDNLPYTRRLQYCLNKVVTPYCIVSQESDILLKYNKGAIETLVKKMGDMNPPIDSVDLVIRDFDCEKEVQITDTLYIMNLKGSLWEQNTGLLYSTQPRLWNRLSAINLFSSIGDVNYKELERAETQEYVKAHQNVYGFCSTQPMTSFGLLSEPFPAAAEYLYVHVTKGAKFRRRAIGDNALHPEIAALDKELYNTYIEPSIAREKTTGDGCRSYVVKGYPGLFKKP